MEPITVRHAHGSYRVEVGPGLLGQTPSLAEDVLGARPQALITDEVVAAHFDAWRRDPTHPWGPGRTAGAWPAWRLTVPSGETSKSRDRWAALSDGLLDGGLGRDGAIVALGGGVVGDLAGFVAATYMRGIPVVQVPTTLLAMVDASVGGKTAVDTPRGKNLIGAFHQPALVVADPLVIATLEARHFHAGLAEAVKHAVIGDAEYFEWLAERTDAILRRDADTIAELVLRSVRFKRDIVEQDEEDHGIRAVLNAGHTVGHAVEHASGYALLHGEAIALGLVAECLIAERLGVAPAGVVKRVGELLARLRLPIRTPTPIAAEAVLAAGRFDKKNTGGVINLPLPSRLGGMARSGASWTVPVPDAATIRVGLSHVGIT